MAISLKHSTKNILANIKLTTSKSESNRVLIIHAILNRSFQIQACSLAEDTVILKELLSSTENELNVGHAGTTMRFLTAFFATQQRNLILTGSKRMQERPIKILVEALNHIGADITYIDKIGYPPLKINKSNTFLGGEIEIDGSISSQYISALLLIAPTLENGLKLKLSGKIVSKPYIQMTLEIMRHFGVDVIKNKSELIVLKSNYKPLDFKVEADWSAASYWYSIAALSLNAKIEIKGLKQFSLQGDSKIANLYTYFGVKTKYLKNSIIISKTQHNLQKIPSKINFKNFPDLAQTFAVTAAALNISVYLTGLSTLKVKETNRIVALKTELTKCKFDVEIKENGLQINKKAKVGSFKNVVISTYNDHRMAMAFAPLALLYPIVIENENVVKKSYPNFWKDLEKGNFTIHQI